MSNFQGCEELSLENMKSAKLIPASGASSRVVTRVLQQCYTCEPGKHEKYEIDICL